MAMLDEGHMIVLAAASLLNSDELNIRCRHKVLHDELSLIKNVKNVVQTWDRIEMHAVGIKLGFI